ncbi:MAG TPA: hypothetical protein DCM87_04585 [Planctomycetes bacterium]|nr:hypothetical protein [Planctomycetota bacterium]
METVRVQEPVLREAPAAPRPEPPPAASRPPARTAWRYAVRIILVALIVLAAVLLFPSEAR